MASVDKILEKVLRGTSDANIPFRDLRQLLLSLGFDERTSGGHHMFRRAGVRELINIQKEGAKAKPYQVRQVRRIILEHGLAGDF
jgi:hypothetical protein